MKNWKNWILVLLFLLLLGGSWLIWEKYPKEIVKVEVRENEKKIDSLMCVIKEKSLVIDSLKGQREKIIERVVIKVEKLKTLPPDSTIQVFYDGIEAYGEVASEKPTLKEDSSVVCSLDNLRGANIVMAKYEGKLKEIEVYKEIMDLDSCIISDKDSIITESSIIMNTYSQKIDELNNQIKKESKKKKTAISFLLGVIGGLLLLK